MNDVESSRRQLNEVVVPRVKQAPGFQTGFWTAPPGGSGSGLSIVVFDSEQNAQQAPQMVRGGPFPDGVQLEDIEVREVVATASDRFGRFKINELNGPIGRSHNFVRCLGSCLPSTGW